MSKKLTDADIAAVARSLGVQAAALKAVLTVEAPSGGFLDDGQVVILFEPHKFHEYTGGRWSKSHPEISYAKWGARPYGKRSEQHAKLQRAVALDRTSALEAASWGIPQILGRNWKTAGASSLQDFINKMHRSEVGQLELMANFIRNHPAMHKALQSLDWAGFARRYNGTAYRQNQYDTKLAAAYRQHLKGAA